MIKIKLILLCLIATITTSFAQDRKAADPADVATIDGLIKAYYEAVSGPPGLRDSDRMLSLFIPGGKISINTAGEVPTHQLAEEYVYTERFKTLTTDFYEREISRDTQEFGYMANIISTYGISDAMENETYTARGVTIFQMVKTNNRWWIASTMWQREGEDLPIPAHLLD